MFQQMWLGAWRNYSPVPYAATNERKVNEKLDRTKSHRPRRVISDRARDEVRPPAHRAGCRHHGGEAAACVGPLGEEMVPEGPYSRKDEIVHDGQHRLHVSGIDLHGRRHHPPLRRRG
jgi:hypothetical protein